LCTALGLRALREQGVRRADMRFIDNIRACAPHHEERRSRGGCVRASGRHQAWLAAQTLKRNKQIFAYLFVRTPFTRALGR